MARKRAFDEETVLEAIKDLLWNKGYSDTSYADLENVSGLKRTSLYAAFGDKNNLYQLVLDRYQNQSHDIVNKYLSNHGDPLDNIKSLLKDAITAAIQDPDRKGCFINNCSIDRASKCANTYAFVTNNRENMVRIFSDHLSQSKPASDDESIKIMAEYIFTLYSGLMLSVRQGVSADVLYEILDKGLSSLYHS